MRVYSFKADEELIFKVDLLAKKKKVSRSEIIRRALRQYIQESEGLPKIYRTKRITVY